MQSSPLNGPYMPQFMPPQHFRLVAMAWRRGGSLFLHVIPAILHFVGSPWRIRCGFLE